VDDPRERHAVIPDIEVDEAAPNSRLSAPLFLYR
jgi:hypothetical protein